MDSRLMLAAAPIIEAISPMSWDHPVSSLSGAFTTPGTEWGRTRRLRGRERWKACTAPSRGTYVLTESAPQRVLALMAPSLTALCAVNLFFVLVPFTLLFVHYPLLKPRSHHSLQL